MRCGREGRKLRTMLKTALALPVAAIALLAGLSAPAQARPMVAHTLAAGDARLDFLLMREAYKVRREGTKLVFGTPSRCKPRGTITLRVVRASGDATDVVRNQLARQVKRSEVDEREDGGAYAVTSGPDVLGALAVPTSTRGTFLVLRVKSTVYEGCSIGHYREEWAEPLASALATARMRRLPATPKIVAPGRWDSFEFATQDVYVEDVLLPRAFRPRRSGDRLAFGPAGPCAIKGDLRFSVFRADPPGEDDVNRTEVEVRGAKVHASAPRWSREGDKWIRVTVEASGRRPGSGACRAGHYREGFAAPLTIALDEVLVDLD
jgi:hypothetical protein